jgi:hypothetical protein
MSPTLQGRLARAGQAGDDDELIAGNFEVETLEIVLARTDDDPVAGHRPIVSASREAGNQPESGVVGQFGCRGRRAGKNGVSARKGRARAFEPAAALSSGPRDDARCRTRGCDCPTASLCWRLYGHPVRWSWATQPDTTPAGCLLCNLSSLHQPSG